jgi:hypothetical protein
MEKGKSGGKKDVVESHSADGRDSLVQNSNRLILNPRFKLAG